MLFLKTYLFIAIISYIINGVLYNLALVEKDLEETYLQALRVGLLFIGISLIWPVQLVYMYILYLRGDEDGKGDGQN